jgi:hypothetical protein
MGQAIHAMIFCPQGVNVKLNRQTHFRARRNGLFCKTKAGDFIEIRGGFIGCYIINSNSYNGLIAFDMYLI